MASGAVEPEPVDSPSSPPGEDSSSGSGGEDDSDSSSSSRSSSSSESNRRSYSEGSENSDSPPPDPSDGAEGSDAPTPEEEDSRPFRFEETDDPLPPGVLPPPPGKPPPPQKPAPPAPPPAPVPESEPEPLLPEAPPSSPGAGSSDEDAVASFNLNPTASLAFFCSHFGCSGRPDDVARLLRTTDGLLPQQVTDLLLSPAGGPLCRAFFLQAGVQGDFLTAMRHAFTAPFVFPTERRAIWRALRFFAEAFVSANPGTFSEVDDPIVLACALLLGAPGARPPKLGATELTGEQLSALFAAVQAEPLALSPRPPEWVTALAPSMRGLLRRKGTGLSHSSKPEFCVLSRFRLYTFTKNPQATGAKPDGFVRLSDVQVTPSAKEVTQFTLSASGDLQVVKLEGGRPDLVRGIKRILCDAQTQPLRDEWVQQLRMAIALADYAVVLPVGDEFSGE